MKRLFVFLMLVGVSLFIVGCGTTNQKSLNHGDDEGRKGEDYSKIVSSNNQLAFEMLSLLSEEQENAFISPASIFMALSMTYNGAGGMTKDEMAKVLHIEEMNASELNEQTASLTGKLYRDSSDGIEISIGNSIWLNENYQFQKEFAMNTMNYYDAKTEEIDMNNDKSADKINKWIKKSTNGKIEKIVKEPLNPNRVAIILNAIYFNGDWKYTFDASRTKEHDFNLLDGTTTKIPLMELNEKIGYMENDDVQIASLPYGDGELSMNIILPKEKTSLEQIEATMNVESWQQWKASLLKKEGTILLPKFQIEYEIQLNEMLQQLGMASAFEETANFEQMIEEDIPVWISQVMHKSYIEVNEEGTEAAAATSVEMETTSAPIDHPFVMNVNHPFITIITDEETGAILFIGFISNPKTT